MCNNLLFLSTLDRFLYNTLFHDLLLAPTFHHSVWSVITPINSLQPSVTWPPSSVINGHASLHRVSAIITFQTLWRNIGAKSTSWNKYTGQQERIQCNSPVTEYTHKNK